jgi:hypothetical protein
MSQATELVNLYPHPVMIDSDAECRAVLREAGVELINPTHCNNQAWQVFAYSGYYWMCVNHAGHPDAEENGILMLGFPQSVGEEFFRNFVRESIEDNTFGHFDSEAFMSKPIPQF